MGLTFFLLCSYLIWMVIMEMTSLNSSSVVQLWIICFCLVTKSCLTLCDCDSMDCSLPGSSVHGISQARTLEWIVISFFRVSSKPWDGTHLSCFAGRFFTTEPGGKPYRNHVCVCVSRSVMSDFCSPMDFKAHEAPLSMEFSMQDCWSRLPFPSPVNLLDPGIEPGSPALQVDSFTVAIFIVAWPTKDKIQEGSTNILVSIKKK